MPRRSRTKLIDYEPKRRNPITLGNDSNIDNDLKVIRVDSKNSILELSENELKVRGTIDASAITVDGASVQTGTDAGATQLSELSDVAYSSGDLTITGLDKINASGNLDFDVDGNIEFNADGGTIEFNDGSSERALMTTNGFGVVSGKRLMLDADTGQHTYLLESSDDQLDLYVGADVLIRFNEGSSNTANFRNTAVGFIQEEPTFDATDTIITFSTKGNKSKLTLTDNCADIHFKFPAVSGNFICVLLQDGTGGRTISNWKTQDSAGNAGDGNSGLVLWAGGTAPTNTETADKADIASFYWDADNEIAYGTYTYNF